MEFSGALVTQEYTDDGAIYLVTEETPFYPEGGGQVGDRGVIEVNDGGLLEVVDTERKHGQIVHIGKLLRGDPRDFKRGGRVTLRVDRERRDAAMLNHSATHILHFALREILGKDVHQAGSLVAPECFTVSILPIVDRCPRRPGND